MSNTPDQPPPLLMKIPRKRNRCRLGDRSAITAAVVTGSIGVLTPIGVGVAGVSDAAVPQEQVARGADRVAWIRCRTTGVPRYFPVVADREDAWTRYPAQRASAPSISFVNAGEEKPTAFTGEVPPRGLLHRLHAGAEGLSVPLPHERVQAQRLAGERRRRGGRAGDGYASGVDSPGEDGRRQFNR